MKRLFKIHDIQSKLRKSLKSLLLWVVLGSVIVGCKATRNLKNDTKIYGPSGGQEPQEEVFFSQQTDIAVNESTANFDNLTDVAIASPTRPPVFGKDSLIEPRMNLEEVLRISGSLELLPPVAKKTVMNYWESEVKKPGGHCLDACKGRFEKAYEDVNGHTIYQDLPKKMENKYYTPQQAFDHLYASTSGKHKGWRSLPKKYRGKGGAGAIAYAGMGTLVDWFGIWKGELRSGAVMQVWSKKKGYKEVVKGVDSDGFEGFGHSFIFLGYERNENNEITGLKIADQGYQSHRPLVPRDYEVWWAVNPNI